MGVRDCLAMVPTDPATLLVLLAQLPGLIMEIPGAIRNLVDSLRASRGAKYGRLPDSAGDDELDLGDDEMDEEAEELRDGDVYDEEERLSTLPSLSTPQRGGSLGAPSSRPPPAQQTEGSLLGEEFTSPRAGIKKGD